MRHIDWRTHSSATEEVVVNRKLPIAVIMLSGARIAADLYLGMGSLHRRLWNLCA